MLYSPSTGPQRSRSEGFDLAKMRQKKETEKPKEEKTRATAPNIQDRLSSPLKTRVSTSRTSVTPKVGTPLYKLNSKILAPRKVQVPTKFQALSKVLAPSEVQAPSEVHVLMKFRSQ